MARPIRSMEASPKRIAAPQMGASSLFRTPMPTPLTPPSMTTPAKASIVARSMIAAYDLAARPLLLPAAAWADHGARAVGDPQPEVAGKVPGKLVLDLVHLHATAELSRQGGHALVRDAARDHLVEPAQIGVHVQSQAVGRHAAPHPHTDGRQLALTADPDPRMSRQPRAGHAEPLGRRDDRLLEDSDIAAEVERVVELDDRVRDQLARTVEGDVAAAVDAHELRADLAQPLGRGQQVGVRAAAAVRVPREVLEQQQPIADPECASLVRELVL